jgi:hypothetical protein
MSIWRRVNLRDRARVPRRRDVIIVSSIFRSGFSAPPLAARSALAGAFGSGNAVANTPSPRRHDVRRLAIGLDLQGRLFNIGVAAALVGAFASAVVGAPLGRVGVVAATARRPRERRQGRVRHPRLYKAALAHEVVTTIVPQRRGAPHLA